MEEDQKWKLSSPTVTERTCSEHPCKKRAGANWQDLSGITVCVVLALMCVGFCTLIYLKTSELQSRIVRLESQRETLSGRITLEQVEPVILSRLDQILEEVSCLRNLTFTIAITDQVGLLNLHDLFLSTPAFVLVWYCVVHVSVSRRVLLIHRGKVFKLIERIIISF